MKRSAAITSVCLPFEELVLIQCSDSPTVLRFDAEARGRLCRLLVRVHASILPVPPKRRFVPLSDRALPMLSGTCVRDRTSQTSTAGRFPPENTSARRLFRG